MLRIGLLLSGSGVLDGSDPVQTIAWRIAAARGGHLLSCFAPDRDQSDVIGREGLVTDHRRNALAEASRLAGGRVDALETAHADELDLLVVVGGLGVVKTLVTPQEVLGELLARRLLEEGGSLVLLDEAVAWAAAAMPAVGGQAWTLATGDDRDLAAEVAENGHRPEPVTGHWVDSTDAAVSSLSLGGDPTPDVVLDLCVEGLRRVEARWPPGGGS